MSPTIVKSMQRALTFQGGGMDGEWMGNGDGRKRGRKKDEKGFELGKWCCTLSYSELSSKETRRQERASRRGNGQAVVHIKCSIR